MSDQISLPDAIIIGGGIGGLACAVGLTRQGVRVRLYEKSGAFGKVGAGGSSRRTARASSTTTACSRRQSSSVSCPSTCGCSTRSKAMS